MIEAANQMAASWTHGRCAECQRLRVFADVLRAVGRAVERFIAAFLAGLRFVVAVAMLAPSVIAGQIACRRRESRPIRWIKG